ncbi:AraC family transcriptional regulator [Paenibacillus sp. RC67]|uniref:AraC family transcriptional regulator n=1 Tax=Paenibacillus sp. RC67 TaxID=3039392 RepID=UPI0024AD3649|nr:AraC family transcriptional regulator [Paenibacillus sp. RC67]
MHTTPLDLELQTPGSLDHLWFKLHSVEWLYNSGMEQQLTNSHVLLFVKQGTGSLTIDLEQYRLRKEAVHSVRPGQTVGIVPEAGGELEMYVISFDMIGDWTKEVRLPLKVEVPVYPNAQMFILCDLMYSCCRHTHALERFRGQSAFHELLYELIKNIRQEPWVNSRSALEQSRAYIEKHYSDNLTIDQLASIAQISPKYYVDLFKKTYGRSAIDYLTEVRVNKAKQLMAQSGVRLRDISHQVGYNDEFYFSRKFKKEVGVSPTVYMKSRRKRIVAYSPHVLGQLLALKVIPYAAPLHPKWTAYYYKMYRADITLHLSAYRANQDWEANIHALVQAAPDIIISRDDSLHPNERERLEQLAPVFVIPWKDQTWREQLMLTAQQLGAEQEAHGWLTDYDLKVSQIKEMLHRSLGTETILAVSIHKQQCRICPVRGMRDVLYHDLQLLPPLGFDPEHYNLTVPVERLDELDADRILLNVCQEEETLRYWQSLEASPQWLNLKAVRKNQVYPISSDPWREYSAHASDRMVDDLMRLLCGLDVVSRRT